MQISLPSSTHSSILDRRSRLNGGFTLIELMVSIAIMGVITAIVLVKYSAFDGTVLLKSAAYEIALGIREAQVKSISSLRSDTDAMMTLHYPYGMSFSANDPSAGQPDKKTYYAFQFPNELASVRPQYQSSYAKGTYVLDRSMVIEDVCITSSVGTECKADGITRIDVAFRRPEFNALFYVTKNGSAYSPAGGVTEAKIKVKSPDNTNVFSVAVSMMGQITVAKE